MIFVSSLGLSSIYWPLLYLLRSLTAFLKAEFKKLRSWGIHLALICRIFNLNFEIHVLQIANTTFGLFVYIRSLYNFKFIFDITNLKQIEQLLNYWVLTHKYIFYWFNFKLNNHPCNNYVFLFTNLKSIQLSRDWYQ